MGLGIKEKFRAGMGGAQWRAYEITHDASVTTLSAKSLDLDYIDTAFMSFGTQGSTPAAEVTMTVAADHKSLEFSEALLAGDITQILAIGW